MHNLGSGIGLDTSLMEQIAPLIKFLEGEPEKQLAVSSIKTRLDVIIEGLLDNLKHRMFMYVQRMTRRTGTISGFSERNS
jgi:hypothetical protein